MSWSLALRVGVSAGALVLLAFFLDLESLVARLVAMDPVWLAAGLGLATAQVFLSAWRWRFTARRLGLSLTAKVAVREYYLATFLNQVLPGGVAGDVSRAWRHASRPGPGSTGDTNRGRAIRAVVLERLSGQMVMAAAAAASGLVLWSAGAAEWSENGGSWSVVPEGAGVVLVAVAVAAAAALGWAWSRGGVTVRRIARDTWTALLAPRALPVQLLSSGVVVASYIGMGVVAARAVGVATPVPVLAPLVAPVLLAMLLPVGVAGWGVREGAAALLWSAVGLPASEGVATFLAYGLMALVAALPGSLFLRRPSPAGATPSSRDPDRRGRPRPAGSAGRADGGPPKGSRPGEG